MNILQSYQETSIDLEKVITISTNSGGVLTAQLQDAFLYIQDNRLKDEISFLDYLVHAKEKPTQDAIDSFFKHLFFDASLAKQFVLWQRGTKVA